MRNDEFSHYYGRHKKHSPQKAVDTNKRITRKFRIDSDLDRKIENKCIEKGVTFSELNRILWQAYFNVEKNIAWKQEVESWERPKLRQVV